MNRFLTAHFVYRRSLEISWKAKSQTKTRVCSSNPQLVSYVYGPSRCCLSHCKGFGLLYFVDIIVHVALSFHILFLSSQ